MDTKITLANIWATCLRFFILTGSFIGPGLAQIQHDCQTFCPHQEQSPPFCQPKPGNNRARPGLRPQTFVGPGAISSSLGQTKSQ